MRGVLAAALTLFSAGALAGEIKLSQNRDFCGSAMTLQSPMLDRERGGFTTASSAVVLSGVWQACTNANFQGTCVQLQVDRRIASAGRVDDAYRALWRGAHSRVGRCNRR